MSAAEIVLALIGISLVLLLVSKCERNNDEIMEAANDDYLLEMRRIHGDECYHKLRERDREWNRTHDRFGRRLPKKRS